MVSRWSFALRLPLRTETAGCPILARCLRKGGIRRSPPGGDLLLHLILGGAALQRCGNCIVWIATSAAEVTTGNSCPTFSNS